MVIGLRFETYIQAGLTAHNLLESEDFFSQIPRFLLVASNLLDSRILKQLVTRVSETFLDPFKDPKILLGTATPAGFG